jgi:predicted DNA-binding transcriptional regulator AlpA
MHRLLRFGDLVALGLVNNRQTLKNWIRDRGFPRGRLVGPNSRVWPEREIEAWLSSRPTAPKSAPVIKGRRPGRPRKAEKPAAAVERAV